MSAATSPVLAIMRSGYAPLLQIQDEYNAFRYFRQCVQARMGEGHGVTEAARLEAADMRAFIAERGEAARERFEALFDFPLFEGILKEVRQQQQSAFSPMDPSF